jgi:hypothetical protein
MAKSEEEILKEDKDLLRHATGAELGRYPKRIWGYRNRFISDPGCDTFQGCMRNVQRGWMFFREPDYFTVSRLGCEQIGMHKAAIKRAIA